MRIGFFIAAIALAAIVILGIQYGPQWFDDEPAQVDAPMPAPAEQPAVDTVTPPPEPMPAEPQEPQIVLPELDASDAFVLEALAGFGLPAQWLDREDLLRRLAVVVDNAARGELPRRQLAFLRPSGGFKVIKRGDEIFIDPASYARYDAHLDVIEAVDPQTLAKTVKLLEPLIVQGLAELGNQQGLSEQINAAIASISTLQGLGQDVTLIQPQVLYQYADPVLEARSPLQKQALRLGPDNLARLQAYLQKFQQAFEGGVFEGGVFEGGEAQPGAD